MSFTLDDYVDVAERLREFYERYPSGRVVTEMIAASDTRVIYRAAVYRDKADTEPAGVGHSSMAIPGKTPYTKDAEHENCETSAVGRAIVMAGIPSKRVASADEVRAKRSEPTPLPRRAPVALPPEEPPPPAPVQDDVWAGVPEDIRRGPDPASPFYGWKVGERHDPTHNPLKYEPPPKNWFHCPTRVGEGWCQWRAKEHPKP